MKFLTKWLRVPSTNETRLVEAVQLWEVRWWSRHGGYSSPSLVSAQPEMECFTSEAEAIAFRDSLKAAFAILRYSGTGIEVSIARATGAHHE